MSFISFTLLCCYASESSGFLLFIFTIFLCIPYAFIRVEEYKDKTMDRIHDEFSELSDKELIDTFKRAHALPSGKQKGMYIGMLESELERRFGGTES